MRQTCASRNLLYKNLPIGTNIQLINSIGVVVFEHKINKEEGSVTIDVTSLSEGIYLINLGIKGIPTFVKLYGYVMLESLAMCHLILATR